MGYKYKYIEECNNDHGVALYDVSGYEYSKDCEFMDIPKFYICEDELYIYNITSKVGSEIFDRFRKYYIVGW